MAFQKRGSRRIVVDGVTYRWRLPHKLTQGQEDGWPGEGITVSPVDCNGAVLLVCFRQDYRLDGPCGDKGNPILPAEVARRIRQAVSNGWQADRPGKRFVLYAEEA